MTDEELKQAIAELQEVVRCRCDEAYRDRGLKDPQCECDSAEAVKVVARRIEELTAKLAKAVEALGRVMVGGNHLATILPDSFPPAETAPLSALEIMGYGYDFEVWCCWRSIMLARNTLAELTGGKDE